MNAYQARAAVLITLSLMMCYILFVKFLAPRSWLYSSEVKQSSRLIQDIEGFRLKNGRVPTEAEVSSLKNSLGLPTGMQCPCYKAEGINHYTVWFGTTLGSSYVFDSIAQEWQEGG